MVVFISEGRWKVYINSVSIYNRKQGLYIVSLHERELLLATTSQAGDELDSDSWFCPSVCDMVKSAILSVTPPSARIGRIWVGLSPRADNVQVSTILILS